MARPLTVLMVNDDKLILARAADLLQPEGVVIQPAKDLIEMSEWLTRDAYDLLLLDEMMPDLLGHDLVPYLKQSLRVQKPIILCSALDHYKVKRLGEQCGADGTIHLHSGLKDFTTTILQLLKDPKARLD